MIPILYEKDETAFISNGLGRLRDAISVVVTEERNGIYECDFEYPVDGANFDKIQVGRIIGVTHDETGDIQPFDIVSYTRPIDHIVTFHCTHISYRQSYLTVTGSNINSLADAFTLLGNATPTNPFTYWTDKTTVGYMSGADGLPKTVRSLLGGIEGSILDTYGGEYEWDGWTVKLHQYRGEQRNFTIRYGVNMLDYNEEYSTEGTYSACIPYWTDGENTVIGDKQTASSPTITGRGECVPMDLSDKFDSQPTKAQVEAMGSSRLNSDNAEIPVQTISVEFVRLQDLGMDEFVNLMSCRLCDTIRVVFPSYNATGNFKIVKTVWNVLTDRYDEMELGQLSTTLAEALGVGEGGNTYVSSGGGGGDIDSAMSDSSENAVQNKVIKAYVDNHKCVDVACGNAQPGQISASSYKDVSITHNLGSGAHVVATMLSSGTAVNIGNTTVSVYDITSTTAKIRIFNNRSSTITPQIEWIAIKL